MTWLAKLAHFPDNDPPNDTIRLITIDEATLQDPPTAGWAGYRFPRIGDRRAAAEARQGRRQGGRLRPRVLRARAQPARGRGLQGRPEAHSRSVLGMTVDVTPGGIMSFEKPPPDIAGLVHLGSTTVDNPGGWLVGQPYVITDTTAYRQDDASTRRSRWRRRRMRSGSTTRRSTTGTRASANRSSRSTAAASS